MVEMRDDVDGATVESPPGAKKPKSALLRPSALSGS